jgi:hypothetical protein
MVGKSGKTDGNLAKPWVEKQRVLDIEQGKKYDRTRSATESYHFG